jgi:hypothetical protein
MASKGDPDFPNEDAALAREEDDRTLIAVADAHHGIAASHDLLEAVAALPMPKSFDDLVQGLASMDPSGPAGDSATTLVTAVLNRTTGQGFGISFGDSSLVRIGPGGIHVLNVRRATYLRPGEPDGMNPELGHGFNFFIEPGELLAAYTDGIDECHYRSPATSVRSEHLAEIFARTGPHPEAFGWQLSRLALDGVDGNPGGQDNIALVVTAADAEFIP